MAETPSAVENEGETQMRIKVSDGKTTIYISLYDSALAESLVRQLPLTLPLTDYSNNEKYVQTPETLTTDEAYGKACPAGSLGYFAPWNNLCFFYGEAPAYPGQYLIGVCENDASEMESLTGMVTIDKVE